MPIERQVRITRTAISPRLAMRIFVKCRSVTRGHQGRLRPSGNPTIRPRRLYHRQVGEQALDGQGTVGLESRGLKCQDIGNTGKFHDIGYRFSSLPSPQAVLKLSDRCSIDTNTQPLLLNVYRGNTTG